VHPGEDDDGDEEDGEAAGELEQAAGEGVEAS
jgi:hypothetical protein